MSHCIEYGVTDPLASPGVQTYETIVVLSASYDLQSNPEIAAGLKKFQLSTANSSPLVDVSAQLIAPNQLKLVAHTQIGLFYNVQFTYVVIGNTLTGN